MGPVADQHGFGGRWRYNMVEGRKDMIIQLNPDTLTGNLENKQFHNTNFFQESQFLTKSKIGQMDCQPFDEPEFTTTTTTTTTTEGKQAKIFYINTFKNLYLKK